MKIEGIATSIFIVVA